ncbi:Hypothetical protein RAK1035_2782 [Roseovarius sp. AK1035]|nr:Hypothetical protein RAK1035_2782 [Roseovarius sp. AK1035]
MAGGQHASVFALPSHPITAIAGQNRAPAGGGAPLDGQGNVRRA